VLGQTRARRCDDISNVDRLTRLPIDHLGYDEVTGTTITELNRRALLASEPAIPPAEHRREHREEIAPLLRELILEARRPLRVSDPLEQPSSTSRSSRWVRMLRLRPSRL